MNIELDSLLEFLMWKRHQQTIFTEWKVGPSQATSRKEDVSMSLIMTVVQECPLSVAFTDAKGNPAKVESGAWSSSNEAIVKIATGDDPTQVIVWAVGAIGTAQVNVKADARFGPEVKEIIGMLDVEIVGAEATTVVISAGTPSDVQPHIEPHKKK
jgi:hypothetical protein